MVITQEKIAGWLMIWQAASGSDKPGSRQNVMRFSTECVESTLRLRVITDAGSGPASVSEA
jgi:hypothetical protein